MSFIDFFHQNIFLFIALIIVLAIAIFFTVKDMKGRSGLITSEKLAYETNRNALLFDLRPEHEYHKSHIPNAKNIIFESLEHHLNSFGKKEGTIILYCETGKKSAIAAKTLRDKGFINVFELDGGFETWKKDNMPVASK